MVYPKHPSVTFSSARDLADWVADHMGDDLTDEDRDAICLAIWNDPDCPNWGDDWRPFLDSLPDPLLELIDED